MLELSGILTIYNRADLLPRVLESIERQTLDQSRYEIVVVDDGSSDESGEIVQQYAGRIPLRYYYQENAGLGAARNFGIEMAKAEVVLLMDDDDIILPDNLKEHAESHRLYPDKEVAVLGLTRLEEERYGDPLMHFTTEVAGYLFYYKDLQPFEFYGFDHFWGGRTSFKKEFGIECGNFNPMFRFGCEDIELAYRMAKHNLRVFYNPNAVSEMIRTISYDAFINRLRRQGQSQYKFYCAWQEEKAREWCQIDDYEQHWPEIRPFADLHIRRARALDKWVRESKQFGIGHEPDVEELLHAAYHSAFRAAKLGGIDEQKAASEMA